MYLYHSCNIIPESYCENFSLKDSDSNAGEEGICKHKSCVERTVFFFFFFFIIPIKFNVQFIPYQDKENSVQGSIISGGLRLSSVLTNYPSLSFCRFVHDCLYWLNTCV